MSRRIGVASGFANMHLMQEIMEFDKQMQKDAAKVNFQCFPGSNKQKHLTRKNKKRKH